MDNTWGFSNTGYNAIFITSAIHYSCIMISKPTELLVLYLISMILFQERIPADHFNVHELSSSSVKSELYWNKTASSLNEFGRYKVNRRIMDGVQP